MTRSTSRKTRKDPKVSAARRGRAPVGAVDPDRAVAVVGLACAFPGATDATEFWSRLYDGDDCITEVPAERFDIDAYYDPRPGTPGRIITRYGGFLAGIDSFDADFFGVAPREAQHMDPQQRLLLQTVAEAAEDAGLTRERLTAGRTGVFVGSMGRNYWETMSRRGVLDVYANAGTAPSMLSGRLSYAFDLRGPSLTVDTACSSSLTAVHMACRSLRSGESSLALVGGVNLVLAPEESITFSDGRMLSPGGRCRFAGAAADGFVRSEGVGVVVLKLLRDALADGDAVRAVILGSAAVNDGRAGDALMAPAESGQRETLSAAYADAGVAPADVGYVEAHGTGTPVGDPVELRALSAVLGEGRAADRPLLVGSAKTNIGHCEGAAGIAGLIKTVMMLERGVVPPSLHSAELTSAVDWPSLPLRVPQRAEEWAAPEAGPRLAGVSAFGISGTNVHLVLAAHEPAAAPARDEGPPEAERPELLTLSSHLPETLRRVAADYREFLSKDGTGGALPLRDVCASAAVRRDHRESRLTLVGSSHREMVDGIDAFLAGEPGPALRSADDVYEERARVVFVFPGQGSQWVGMGRELLRTEPAFRRAMEECDTAIRAETGWSVLERLTDGEGALEGVDVVQPTLWAMEVALASVWRSWGLEPDVVVGHSMGEAAAAVVAGSLSVADGAAVICRRSALAKRVAGRGGAMASVELSAAEAERELEPYGGRVCVAAVNGPSSTILSGDGEAMKEILVALQKRGVFCRLVQVDFASHGPQVEPLREPLLKALESVSPRAGEVTMYSTVDAEPVDGSGLDAEYWSRNLRLPVRFGPVIESLLERGRTVLVEISPHPILVPAMREYADRARGHGLVVGSTRRNEPETATLLDALASVHLSGHPVDFGRLFAPVPPAVRLPGPAWERQRYWFPETAGATPVPAPAAPVATEGAAGHPLLGVRLPGPDPVWEGTVDLAANAYLADHQVQGVVIVPGTAYVELVAAAGAAAFGAVPVLEEVAYHRAIYLPPGEEPPVVRVALTPDGADGVWSFEVSSRYGDEPEFVRNVGGRMLTGGPAGAVERAGEDRDVIRARCEELSGAEFYRRFAEKGNQWLGAFQGVSALWRRDGEALARIVAPPSVDAADARQFFHPALLDACGHTLAAATDGFAEGSEHDAFVLGGIGRVRFHRRPDGPVWSHAVQTEVRPDAVVGTVQIRTDDGALVAELEGVSLRFLIPRPSASVTGGGLHDVVWRAAPPVVAAGPRDGYWLLFGDGGPWTAALAGRLGGRAVLVEAGEAYERTGPDRYRIDPDAADDYRRLLTDVGGASDGSECAGVVHLWSRAVSDPAGAVEPSAAVARAQSLGCHSVLRLVRALDEAGGGVGRLCLVTEGAQYVPDAPGPVSVGQSMLWGFGRALIQEYPGWGCALVDLAPGAGEADAALLAAELLAAGDGEGQVVFRNGTRRVPRLVRRATGGEHGPASGTGTPAVPERYEIRGGSAGVLDEVGPVPVAARTAGPGEVEIRVTHAALNYRDVLTAMGAYPGLPAGAPLGWECAGVVTALGPGAAGVRVGDEVVALTEGALASHAVADARLVARVPSRLSVEEALTLPAAYLTAYYGLCELGGLAPGERVLIHAATGGVGLAAVQLARWRGAEIFATAGSPRKRALLKTLGIRHVADSRSTDFVAEFRDATRGAGMDVVLNSLAGDAIPGNLSLMAPYGRYIEMSKRDLIGNSPIGLEPFSRNLAFHSMDLVDMLRNRPDRAGALLDRVLELVDGRAIEPLPYEVFDAADVESAFRLMARARQVGKVLVRLDQTAGTAGAGGATDPAPERAVPGRAMSGPADSGPAEAAVWRASEGTYLITGGLGGIGVRLAEWLVDRGARDLVLLGRGPLGARGPVLEELGRTGARVTYHAVDVADEGALRALLGRLAAEGRPPVRGVLHTAGVIDLVSAAELTPEAFDAMVRPKVTGAWALHRVLDGVPLEFFALFSSASAVLGSPRLGGYAAANAGLDALAHHRRSLGLPALSVNWGFWSTVGMVARYAAEHGRDLAPNGMESFTPEEGIAVLERLLTEGEGAGQVTVLAVDWERWGAAYPDAARDALLAEVLGGAWLADRAEPVAAPPAPVRVPAAAGPVPVPPVVVAAPPVPVPPVPVPVAASAPAPATAPVPVPAPAAPAAGAAADGTTGGIPAGAGGDPDAVRAFLTDRVSKVLALPARRLNTRKPLSRQGLDSLMATEVRSEVQREYAVTVPLARMLGGQSLDDLAEFIADELTDRS
ncbi:SDR family NAD(P)-dependent oxidoreductase [Streptomyces sp. NPDC020875]|uniref:SDR family NAD(P)-dependent oxidoreductase n=1 Tax=Streptomyces sp. NPDC020875 TaxID=3154898 RepID=UPI0033E55DB7